MKPLKLFIFVILPLFLFAKQVKSCSTFLLKSDSAIFVGHNLDESPNLHIPGLVCVNKRNIYREGITWSELTTTPTAYEKATIPFKEKIDPKISWVSQYGSITFNSEGLDFPDGGINEKGLAVFEMSLGGTEHKYEKSNPTLFMVLWIQYVLDTCFSLDEVITSAQNINLQGWSWHYFVSDKSGDCAIIEFIKGEVVVHRGQDIVYPVLCNASYKYEINRLKEYQDFDGMLYKIRSFVKKPPRFIRGTKMLHDFDPSIHSPKEYAFDILDEIKINGWNKWGILVDVNNMTVYYHTHRNREIRHISFSDFDFSSGTASQLFDIHGDGAGEVSAYFVDYTFERNLKLAQERADLLFVERLNGLKNNGVTAEIYAKRYADYSKRIRSGSISSESHLGNASSQQKNTTTDIDSIIVAPDKNKK